jgi:hypothetical protein
MYPHISADSRITRSILIESSDGGVTRVVDQGGLKIIVKAVKAVGPLHWDRMHQSRSHFYQSKGLKEEKLAARNTVTNRGFHVAVFWCFLGVF